MNRAVLAQLDRLTELQRAVRDHFQQGGSATSVLLLLAVIIAVVMMAKFLTQRQRRSNRSAGTDPGRELFVNLLTGLELTQSQQRVLVAVAHEQRLKNPSVILLCPTLFDRYVGQWLEQPRRRSDPEDQRADAESITRLRKHLFPPVLSRVGTLHMGL